MGVCFRAKSLTSDRDEVNLAVLMSQTTDPGEARRPHRFFFAFVVVALVGVVAASTAPASDASWALGSRFVNRCEVGLVVGGILYLVVTGAWLAWHGHYLGQLQLPGGLGGGGESQPIDSAAAPVDATADDFNEYRKDVDRRFKGIENAVGNMLNRLNELERSRLASQEIGRGGRLLGKLRRHRSDR